MMNKSATINPTGITQIYLTPSNVRTNYVTVNLTTYPDLYKYISGVVTLNGLEIFTSNRTIYMTDQFINNASALSGLTSLTQVRIENCMLSDISWASTLTNCTYFSFRNNPIKTTHNAGVSYFPDSAATIILTGCGPIISTDVAAMSTVSKLSTLLIDNTTSSKQFETLDALISVLSNAVRDSSLVLSVLSLIHI